MDDSDDFPNHVQAARALELALLSNRLDQSYDAVTELFGQLTMELLPDAAFQGFENIITDAAEYLAEYARVSAQYAIPRDMFERHVEYVRLVQWLCRPSQDDEAFDLDDDMMVIIGFDYDPNAFGDDVEKHGHSPATIRAHSVTKQLRRQTVHVPDQSQCSICLEPFAPTMKVQRLTCHHLYHPPCIGRWLEHNVTCPLCGLDLLQLKSPPKPSIPPPAKDPLPAGMQHRKRSRSMNNDSAHVDSKMTMEKSYGKRQSRRLKGMTPEMMALK